MRTASFDHARRLGLVAIASASFSLVFLGCGDDDTPLRDAGSSDATDSSDARDASPDAAGDASIDDGPVRLVFDVNADHAFFDRPFPLDTRRGADGHPSLAGFPNPRDLSLVSAVIALSEQETNGFSPAAAIWLRFTGPLDAGNVPTPERSLESDSPVVLVNVDAESAHRGQRVPVIVAQTDRDESFRPAHLLQVRPLSGFNLDESTLYALVVHRNIGSGDAERPLEVDPVLADLLAGREPDAADATALVSLFAPLRAWLAGERIDVEDVVGATVFRTGDVTSRLYRTVELVSDEPVREPTAPLERTTLMDEYCGYEATWAPSLYQEGEPPYMSAGGRMVLDDDGRPVEQAVDEAPFVVTVPRGPMPAAGYPLLFYVNGTGGLARQIMDRGVQPALGVAAPPGTGPAQIVARRGWGTSGHAALIAPERSGDAAVGGYAMYNFFNPLAMRDNFFQAVVEHVLFRRLVLSLRIDPATCPGVDASAASDGMVRFDAEHMVVMGQSLGSYLSEMLAATDAGFDGVILSGAGGSWAEFALGPSDPVPLMRTIELSLALPSDEHLDRFHPAVGLFELAVAEADNTEYADDLLRHPRAGREALPVLVINGHDDQATTFGLQQGLSGALGVDLVGSDVGPVEQQVLGRILLAGGAMVDAPVRGNIETPSGPRTGGMVRYLPDFAGYGHHVAFQLTPPRHQYACFLETLYDEGGPLIVRGGDDPDLPCE